MTALAAAGIDDMSLKLLVGLVALASFAIVIYGFSAVSRRLLGIRVGLARAVLAGVVGLATMAACRPMVRHQGGVGALSGLQFALALLAAMGTLVLVEVFLPYGRVRPVRLWNSMKGRLVRARRYSQISRIFIRHGVGRPLRSRAALERALRTGEFGERSARSLRFALEECGGAFVKLGQVMSTRRDLLPPHFIEELRHLQSSVSAAPWSEVEAVLRSELGVPPEEVFEWIEEVPLAAASIAQVHRARLRDGPTVVVKVQRPGIREVVERDLDIVVAITRGFQSRARSSPALGLSDLGEGFSRSVREELDFRIEARNSVAVAMSSGGFEADAPVRIPRVHQELSSARVLVQEWLQGVTLDRAGPVADGDGLDRHELARTAFASLLHQILRAGVFHADPHPGNMLLLEDGRIALLDFGSVGRIDPSVRRALQELLVAVDRGDPSGLHDALIALLGTRARGEDLLPEFIQLERELGQFMARHLGVGARADTEMFSALLQVLTRFGLVVPPEVAAVFRALATIEGTLEQFAPGFDLLEEARAIAGGLLTDRLLRPSGAGGGGLAAELPSLMGSVAREVLSVLPMLRRLPRRAERISASLEEGRFSVRVSLLADEREQRFVSGLLHQLTVTLLAACTGLMGVLLLVFGTGRGPHVTAQLELFPLLGYQVLVVSAMLMLRALYKAMRRPTA